MRAKEDKRSLKGCATNFMFSVGKNSNEREREKERKETDMRGARRMCENVEIERMLRV